MLMLMLVVFFVVRRKNLSCIYSLIVLSVDRSSMGWQCGWAFLIALCRIEGGVLGSLIVGGDVACELVFCVR